MKPVRSSVVVEAPGVEAEQLWYDRWRWASWIDGFGHLARLDDEWPLAGARRVWDSPVGGRERVSETVKRYVAGSELVSLIEDARVSGVERVTFETDGQRTRITVELDLSCKEQLAPGRRWWLRRQLGQSLARTLQRFTYELAADR